MLWPNQNQYIFQIYNMETFVEAYDSIVSWKIKPSIGKIYSAKQSARNGNDVQQ